MFGAGTAERPSVIPRRDRVVAATEVVGVERPESMTTRCSGKNFGQVQADARALQCPTTVTLDQSMAQPP